MKKIIGFMTLFIFIAFCPCFAGDVIKGLLPEKLPTPEKCSACHNIPQQIKELSQSAHKDMKCFDCHLPGAVQRVKYESKDCSFKRLGYHDKDGNWIEVGGNEGCLRCHEAMGIKNTNEKCWSCHMPEAGVDEIIILKDKIQPVTPDNIRETKKLPHRSHTFKIHPKGGIEK
jgi:nitrate/TMAO reductase-like tetraheme cytochrome c subunit